jgi:hypothetical protein
MALGAIVDHSPDGLCMVSRVFRGTPDAGDAMNSASAFLVVVWAIHFSPRVRSTKFDASPIRFRVPQGVLNVFLGM